MFPVEILNIWTDVCQKKHILWYLYGPTLLCAHGYGYFPEELSCAQVAVFQEDVQALKNEIFPYLRKRGYGVSNGNDNIQIVLHQNTVLSIYVLDREKQSAVFWKPKMMACEQKRGGQKKQFPVFSGYQDYLLVEFGDYENGLFDEVGCGLSAEDKLTLKEHQARCKEALRFIAQLSEEYGLQYYLLAGSVLGCVRHGGFIPWDDDIDVGIRVENLDRFEAIINDHIHSRLPNGFQLRQVGPDNCYPRMFSKICYEGRCCIDLWPLVPSYTKGLRAEFTTYFARLITKVHYKKIEYPVARYSKLANVLSLFISDKTALWLARWNERKYQKKQTPAYINLYSVYRREKETILRRWLDKEAFADFDGIAVPIVGETQEYLTHLYGDYSTIPAPWERASRHYERF